jgi:hypothetical protein
MKIGGKTLHRKGEKTFIFFIFLFLAICFCFDL